MYDSRTDKCPNPRNRYDREETRVRRTWNRGIRAKYAQAIREGRWDDLPKTGRPGTQGWLTW